MHAEHVLTMLQRPKPGAARTVPVAEVYLNHLIRVRVWALDYRNAADARQRARALTGLYAELERVEWEGGNV